MLFRYAGLYVSASALLTALIYCINAGDFLLFDSKHVFTNTHLVLLQHQPEVFSHWRSAILSSDTGFLKRPLSMLSFAAQIAGNHDITPYSLRIGNIAIHLLTGGLLFVFMRQLSNLLLRNWVEGERNLFALLVASIWLLHPLHVSTVLYTVQRMAQLPALFMLGGLIWYLHYRRQWLDSEVRPDQKVHFCVGLIVWTALAALSKENGLLLPWFIVLLEMLVFRCQINGKRSVRSKYICITAFCLPVFGFLCLLLGTDYFIQAYQNRPFDLSTRLLTQAHILWNYVGWFFLPDIRTMGFYHDDIPLVQNLFQLKTIVALLGWLSILAAAIAVNRKWPIFSLGVMWFLIGHSMESTVLPLELVFEHRNYFPVIGLAILLAGGLVMLLRLTQSKILYTVPVSIVLILTLLLSIRASYWQNEETLSAHQLANHPGSARSIYYYANVHLRSALREKDRQASVKKLSIARSYYERMHQIDRNDFVPLITLFYIDSRFLGNVNSELWLEKLLRAVDKPALTASDRNSLNLLLDCLVSGYGTELLPKVENILQQLNKKHGLPEISYIQAMLEWKLKGNLSDAKRYLSTAIKQQPHALDRYYRMISLTNEMGQEAEKFHYIRQLMANDRWMLESYSLSHLLTQGELSLEANLFDQ